MSTISPHENLVQDGTVDITGKPANRHYTGGWRACAFIYGNEISDTIGYFGIVFNLITYLTEELHEGTAAAAKNVHNWSGTALMVPLLGAFVADAYWGRYKTILVSAGVYLTGLVLLTLSATLDQFKPEKCSHGSCPRATQHQLAFFFFALYLLGIGSGAMKPCNSSFGADQFDGTDLSERKSKSSFFNWWSFGIHFAMIAAATLLVYVQEHLGWGLGFGIPTVLLAMAMAVLLAGTKIFRFRKPAGSPLTKIAQVVAAAFYKRKNRSPSDITQFYEDTRRNGLMSHTDQFRFLDKAATIIEDDLLDDKTKMPLNPWRLCPISQVEDTKLILRIMPIWAAILPYSVAISQVSTFFVRQGSRMNRHLSGNFTIPAASMGVFDSITAICCIPIYDRILVPLLRKITGHTRGISMLQRMGIGMIITVVAMVVAATTENKRLNSSNHDPKHPITVFWLLPQYILLGIASVFVSIGQIEFFYDQAPDSMQSLGSALFLANMGVGHFLSSILISLANQCSKGHPWISDRMDNGRLDLFYWLLACLIGLDVFGYILLSWWYRYKSTIKYTVADYPTQEDIL